MAVRWASFLTTAGALAEDHGGRRNCLFCGLWEKSPGQEVAERRVRNRESSGAVPDSRPRRKLTETDGQGCRAGAAQASALD